MVREQLTSGLILQGALSGAINHPGGNYPGGGGGIFLGDNCVIFFMSKFIQTGLYKNENLIKTKRYLLFGKNSCYT